MLEGVGKHTVDRDGNEVINITKPVAELEMLIAAAKAGNKTMVTFSIQANSFEAGADSPAAGQQFHRFQSRLWVPKAKKS